MERKPNPVEVIRPYIAKEYRIHHPKRYTKPDGVVDPPPRAGRVLCALAQTRLAECLARHEQDGRVEQGQSAIMSMC